MNNPNTPEMILALCDLAAGKISISNSGVLTQPGYGDSRLIENGVTFHTLGKDGISAAIFGLSKILSPTENHTFANSEDHYHLWAWCAELFTNSNSPIYKGVNNNTAALMRLVAHTALSRCGPEITYHGGVKLGVHSRSVLANTHTTLQYLVFPLLEAMLRYVCREYVESDGKVKKPFRRNGTRYYSENERCNNLGHLVNLYREINADAPSKKCTIDLLNLIEPTRPDNDIAGWLYKCRNGALHGEVSRFATAALVLNIFFSLCLAEISDDVYASERDRVFPNVVWNQKYEIRPEWSFYPPEF